MTLLLAIGLPRVTAVTEQEFVGSNANLYFEPEFTGLAARRKSPIRHFLNYVYSESTETTHPAEPQSFLTPFLRWLPDLEAAMEKSAGKATVRTAVAPIRQSEGVITTTTDAVACRDCAVLPWEDCGHTAKTA